jgi:hypothetical protein
MNTIDTFDFEEIAKSPSGLAAYLDPTTGRCYLATWQQERGQMYADDPRGGGWIARGASDQSIRYVACRSYARSTALRKIREDRSQYIEMEAPIWV